MISIVLSGLLSTQVALGETLTTCRVADSIETVEIAISDSGSFLSVDGQQDAFLEESIVSGTVYSGTTLVDGYVFPYSKLVYVTDKSSLVEVVDINGMGRGVLTVVNQPKKSLVQCLTKSIQR